MEDQDTFRNFKISKPENKFSNIIDGKESKNKEQPQQFVSFLHQNFFSNKYFKKFFKTEIAIHKKGNNKAFVWGMNRIDEKIDFVEINTPIYNSLFNHIKKSKSKVFYKTDEDALPFSVNGSFLGKEYELNNLRIVLVVSNGGFLPYESQEINDFSIKSKKIATETLDVFNSIEVEKKINLEDYAITFLNSFDFYSNLSDLSSENNSKQIVSEIFHHNKIELFSEILNNLKHEISNPLFGISLASKEILETLQNENQCEINEMLKGIEQNADRCHQIIQNFQNVYDPFIGHKRVELNGLIKDTIRLTKSEIRGIKIVSVKNSSSLDEEMINTNPIIVGQILFNLIINAAQAINGSKKIENESIITVSLKRDKKFITLEVIDNGPGIPNDIGAKIFNPFFTTKDNGTGLGLCICKKLAEKIKANLTYNNNLTMPGVTFSLQLPYENSSH